MNFKKWLIALGQAALQGALIALSGALVSGHTTSPKELAATACAGALVAVGNHFRTSPAME